MLKNSQKQKFTKSIVLTMNVLQNHPASRSSTMKEQKIKMQDKDPHIQGSDSLQCHIPRSGWSNVGSVSLSLPSKQIWPISWSPLSYMGNTCLAAIHTLDQDSSKAICFCKKSQSEAQGLWCLNLPFRNLLLSLWGKETLFSNGTPEVTPVPAMLGYQTKPCS